MLLLCCSCFGAGCFCSCFVCCFAVLLLLLSFLGGGGGVALTCVLLLFLSFEKQILCARFLFGFLFVLFLGATNFYIIFLSNTIFDRGIVFRVLFIYFIFIFIFLFDPTPLSVFCFFVFLL